jgi:hypothetical protein
VAINIILGHTVLISLSSILHVEVLDGVYEIAIPLDMHDINLKKLWKIATYIYIVASTAVSRKRLIEL